MATVLQTFVGDLNRRINSYSTGDLIFEIEEVRNLTETLSKESELEIPIEKIALVHEKVASNNKTVSPLLKTALFYLVCLQFSC